MCSNYKYFPKKQKRKFFVTALFSVTCFECEISTLTEKGGGREGKPKKTPKKRTKTRFFPFPFVCVRLVHLLSFRNKWRKLGVIPTPTHALTFRFTRDARTSPPYLPPPPPPPPPRPVVDRWVATDARTTTTTHTLALQALPLPLLVIAGSAVWSECRRRRRRRRLSTPPPDRWRLRGCHFFLSFFLSVSRKKEEKTKR